MNAQILLIDDSPKIHTLVRAILSKEPVDVHSATDPRHGLVLAASLRPDMILLDVDMPDLNGFETAQRLKANAGSRDCPLIFLTSHSAIDEKVKGFGLGAVDYVTKPFNAAELCMRVRASLKTSRTIRKLENTALIDPLSGLGNRTMFESRLDAEVPLRARSKQALSVMAVELNDFATVETAYGAKTAGKVIRYIGGVIKDACGPEAVVCRLDGPSYAVLLPQASDNDVRALADGICSRVARLKFEAPTPLPSALSSPTFSVTAKTGSASAIEPYDRSMLQRAQGHITGQSNRAA